MRNATPAMPDLALADLRADESAFLILPGADIWTEPKTDPALEKAKEFVKAGVPVAAICGATFGLARSGLLDHRRHTSNAPVFLQQSGYAGAPHYLNDPVVEDRGVITASAMASLEFARQILARLAVFSEKGLAAWYGLYKTSDPRCYFTFIEELAHAGAA
jgi:putative intracellular protease/amidase